MLLKTFAQTENSSQGEEANGEIHMAMTEVSLHMLVMELLQKFGAKEKIDSAVICSTFSKTNGLKPDRRQEGTSLLAAEYWRAETGGNVRGGFC